MYVIPQLTAEQKTAMFSTSELDSKKNVTEKQTDSSEEKTLSVIATIALLLGIITSLIMFIGGCNNLDSYSNVDGGMLIVLSLCVLFSSIMTWAFLKVIVNISNSLKEITQKIK